MSWAVAALAMALAACAATPRSPARGIATVRAAPVEARGVIPPGAGTTSIAGAPTAATSAPAPFARLDPAFPGQTSLGQTPPGAAAPAGAPVGVDPSSDVPPASGSDPAAPESTESDAVAARFPDPDLRWPTPAFEPGHTGTTSNAELSALMHRLASAHPDHVTLVRAGNSQTGQPIEALAFSHDPAFPGVLLRPTVLLVGQQHGNEPAGAEALAVVATQLADGPLAPLLERINVVVLPRANPDGAAAGRRTSASGIDINRDHLLLRTPEAQAQAQLVRDYKPVVVVDSHEFLAVGRYLPKFGAVQRYDALLQYAMVANLPEFVTRAAEEWFRAPLVKRLKQAGLTSEWYYTTSADLADRKLAMGGVQPDNARNAFGLRNAVSLLVETRGSDLGRAHLARRVATHVTAITSVLESTAARAADLTKLRQFVDAEVSGKACQGDVVVDADPTPSEYDLLMLDPVTGVDKPLAVAWDSALQLVPSKVRSRPCGYWLAADQTDAVLRLRALGVQIGRLDEPGEMRGEAYHETAREIDAGTGVTEAGGTVRVKVALLPALVDAAAGSYYVSLEQPNAHLVVAALEPDTRSSYFASRIVASVESAARVMVRPDFKMTPVP